MDDKTMYAALFASALADGGSSGFYPTETQLAAMNSGITAADVTQIGTNETNISSLNGKTSSMGTAGTNYIVVNGIRVYVSLTPPTGDIPDNSIGLGF